VTDTRTADELPLGELLREDLATHDGAFASPGFQALAVHRLQVWAQTRGPLLRAATKWLNILLIRNVYGVELHPTTKIGRRVRIGHHQSVVIGFGVTIGDDCIIRQGLTLGLATDDSPAEHQPVVGDRVQFGANATVVGRVRIGDDARIGPGSVITRNVPAGATTFAQPARVITPQPTGS